jgi:hypothetical protein
MSQLDNFDRDKLKQAIDLCKIHCERMNFAQHKLEGHFPLTIEVYQALHPEDLSFFDQLIFRFSKMQDSMGQKLFPAILINLQEDIRHQSFIDILNRLEALGFIQDKNQWMALRETRNIVTHEYPFVTEEVVDGLNLLKEHALLLTSIWESMHVHIRNRVLK